MLAENLPEHKRDAKIDGESAEFGDIGGEWDLLKQHSEREDATRRRASERCSTRG